MPSDIIPPRVALVDAQGLISRDWYSYFARLGKQADASTTVTTTTTIEALAAFDTNGLLAQTATSTFAGRTIEAGTSNVTITNGDGVAGNPTISVTVGDFGNQAANSFLAAPDGLIGEPSFRAIVSADLPDTAVTPGSYTYASITVDSTGRLTAAASGTAPVSYIPLVDGSVPPILICEPDGSLVLAEYP